MTECNISFLSRRSGVGAADTPGLCTENSLTLHLRLTLSASLHSLCRWGWQRRPAPYFRLIYDLCRGGCIRKISHVNLCHAATTGHETAEEHTSVHTEMLSIKAGVYYIYTALAALQSEEPLSMSQYNCIYYRFLFGPTGLASIQVCLSGCDLAQKTMRESEVILKKKTIASSLTIF